MAFRSWGGTVGAGLGAYVVINADGWFVTAAHVFDLAAKSMIDRPKADALRAQIDQIRADPSLTPGYANREVKKLEGSADRDWVERFVYSWSRPGLSYRDVTIVQEADLAVGRLEPFPADMAAKLPTLKDFGSIVPQGRSICRLGFPFHRLTPKYDPATDTFDFGQSLALTYFPLDGILTRGIDQGMTADGKHPLLHIESSTPGIPGQSGGPWFDVDGNLWGIQSRTQHIPLGFSPEVEGPGGRKVVENQVINLGVATSSTTIISVLRDLGIPFKSV